MEAGARQQVNQNQSGRKSQGLKHSRLHGGSA
jgi:hypothetical protein